MVTARPCASRHGHKARFTLLCVALALSLPDTAGGVIPTGSSSRPHNTRIASVSLPDSSATDRRPVLHDFVHEASCASGSYEEKTNTTGWGFLSLTAHSNCSNGDAGYAMGYLEGSLTHETIYDAFVNFNVSNGFMVNATLPAELAKFVMDQWSWMEQQVAAAMPGSSDYSYWQHVHVLMQHAKGIQDGYRAAASPEHMLSPLQVYILTLAGDLEDLAAAFSSSSLLADQWSMFQNRRHRMEQFSCSGFVKVTEDGLFVGHTTFNAYWCMLRTFKHYTGQFPGIDTAATEISFSARPGDIESKDDFFLLNSRMVVIETSLTVFNKSLYSMLTPHTVPVWIRCQLANRMATSASHWAELFSQHNSGTHNNQWLVTDYNQFSPGQTKLKANTLWMIEQMPGYVHKQDVTFELLEKQSYVGSYNIPYFKDIFSYSGYINTSFSYENDTRARIFRRDNVKVHDIETLSQLMNQNDYKNDPLSGGDPCNQISARCDLPTVGEAAKGADGSPFAFGGIDSKVVDIAHVNNQTTRVIGAPSHVHVPVFAFTSQWDSVSHVGMPHSFDFEWMQTHPHIN